MADALKGVLTDKNNPIETYTPIDLYNKITARLAITYKIDNGRFLADRFLDACGVDCNCGANGAAKGISHCGTCPRGGL